MTQFIAEAEYIDASYTVNQAILLKKLLDYLDQKQDDPKTILSLYQSAVAIFNNLVFL